MLGIARVLLVAGAALLATATRAAAGVHSNESNCNIVIVGGSAAALASALNAADEAPDAIVCLLEPTDWPGGQMTSSAVSAFDYGHYNRDAANQARDWSEMAATIAQVGGQCWVSPKCYEPLTLLRAWILPRIAQHGNLHVYWRTVLTGVTTQARAGTAAAADGQDLVITDVTAVQRAAVYPGDEWSRVYSAEVGDWYSAADSARFRKTVWHFSRVAVLVEASEYGDALVLSGAEWRQGMETPAETSGDMQDGCGQAIVYPFFLRINALPQPPIDVPLPPPGLGNYTWQRNIDTWERAWTYRRARMGDDAQPPAAGADAQSPATRAGGVGSAYLRAGEVSQINIGTPPGNDDPYSWMWLLRNDTLAQAASGNWSGGLSVPALREAELLSYGFVTWLVNKSVEEDASLPRRLSLAYDVAGTQHGLSKVPYLRESRRSVGLGGYKLTRTEAMLGLPERHQPLGALYPDRVALAEYFYGDVHLQSVPGCTYPDYLKRDGQPTAPFTVPFRALTNARVGNMLVAGKSLAQSFHANAATRLHPDEWTSGVAAGVAAAMLLRLRQSGMEHGSGSSSSSSSSSTTSSSHSSSSGSSSDAVAGALDYADVSTGDIYRSHIAELQTAIRARQPLEWSIYLHLSDAVHRSVWVRADAESQNSAEEMAALVRTLAASGVTIIYLDVWRNGTAYFDSPALAALSPSSVGADRLGWALAAAEQLRADAGADADADDAPHIVAWLSGGWVVADDHASPSAFAQVAAQQGWLADQQATAAEWLDPGNAAAEQFVSALVCDAFGGGYVPAGLHGVQLDDNIGWPAEFAGASAANLTALMTRATARWRRCIGAAASAPAGAVPKVSGGDTIDSMPILSLSPAALGAASEHRSMDYAAWAKATLFDEWAPKLFASSADEYAALLQQHVAALGAERLTPALQAVDSTNSQCADWTVLRAQLDATAAAQLRRVLLWDSGVLTDAQCAGEGALLTAYWQKQQQDQQQQDKQQQQQQQQDQPTHKPTQTQQHVQQKQRQRTRRSKQRARPRTLVDVAAAQQVGAY